MSSRKGVAFMLPLAGRHVIRGFASKVPPPPPPPPPVPPVSSTVAQETVKQAVKQNAKQNVNISRAKTKPAPMKRKRAPRDQKTTDSGEKMDLGPAAAIGGAVMSFLGMIGAYFVYKNGVEAKVKGKPSQEEVINVSARDFLKSLKLVRSLEHLNI